MAIPRSINSWPEEQSPFDPEFRDTFNQVAAAANQFLEMLPILTELIVRQEPEGEAATPAPAPIILAKILDQNLEYESGKFQYAWAEVELKQDGSNDFKNVAGGQGGTEDNNYALNGVEAFRKPIGPGSGSVGITPATIWAPGVDVSRLPGDFEMGPIKGEPVVPMFFIPEPGGTLRPVFALVQIPDGTC